MVIKSGTYHRTGNTLEKQSHPPSSPPVENPRVDMAVQTEVQQSSSSLRPEQITPSGYYGFMNDQGQVIYTDISNAVLFDGRQFYVMRGANLSQGQRLPFSMSQASLTIPRLPTPIPAQPPPRLRDFWNRIHFDVTAFLTFMVRLALVVLIFSQGGDKWRVVTVCAVLGIIFFIQAGVVPINIAEHVNRFWEALMRPRRVIQPPQEQAVPAEGVGHGEEAPLRQDLPRQEFQQNPLVKLMEIFTTFILSLFPQEPPRAQRLE